MGGGVYINILMFIKRYDWFMGMESGGVPLGLYNRSKSRGFVLSQNWELILGGREREGEGDNFWFKWDGKKKNVYGFL